jgi:Cu-Zn family superoxide dismutase
MIMGSMLMFGGWNQGAYAMDGKKSAVTVEMQNAQGKSVGTAVIQEIQGKSQIQFNLHDLPPGAHGVHFHENGQCQGPDFQSAGKHYDPDRKEHGLKNPKGSHAGDMPNLNVDQKGMVSEAVKDLSVTLSPGPRSLRKTGGTAIIVHAKVDDQVSNPSGNSGDRIACGVISEGSRKEK